MNAALTVSGALVVFQFFIALILSIGVAITSRGYNPEHGIRIQAAKNPVVILALILISTIITLGPILATDSFAATWGPAYGATSHFGFSIDHVKLWVFVVDILMISWIISKTGGWKSSPFPALPFNIPVIAILLGESGLRVGAYVCLISAIYGLSLYIGRSHFVGTRSGRAEDDVSLWVVTVLALTMTTLIGVFTRHVVQ